MIQVSLDYTLFIQIIQFLLIVYISNRFILKPIKSVIDKRTDKIHLLNQETDKLLLSVERSRIAYENKIINVKKEVADYQESIRQKSLKEVEAILSTATIEIDKESAKSKKEIALEYATAKKELTKEVKSLSKSIYDQISGVA